MTAVSERGGTALRRNSSAAGVPQADRLEGATSTRAVVSLAGLGMLLSTLDTGIINVALPTLQHSFGTSASSITWAVSCYVLALSATIVVFGRLADSVGLVRVFAGGLLAFGAGSLLCGFAGSAGALIAFRTVQGLGAAMLQATALALVMTLVPSERRGAALGTVGVMIGVGPILGPVVGGLLLSSVGWSWLFWINLPLCAAGLVACSRLRHTDSSTGRPQSYDLPGNALLAGGLSAVLVALSAWPRHGLLASQTWAWLVAGIVLLGLFVLRERAASEPALEPDWFGSRAFTGALLATFAFGAAAAVVFIVPPFLLQARWGLQPWQIGLIGMAAPAGLVIASKWSGSQLARRGPGTLMAWGIVLMVGALVCLALTASAEQLAILIVLLVGFGAGGGLFQPANIAGVMAAASAGKQATIGGAQRMVQNLGIALGAMVSAALVTAAQTRHARDSLDGAVAGAWAFAAVGLVVSLVIILSGRARTTEPGA